MRLLLLLSLQAAAALQLPARAPTANRAPTVQMGAEPFDPRIEELIGEHKVGRRLPRTSEPSEPRPAPLARVRRGRGPATGVPPL